MYKRILVPLDGSKLAEGVLPEVRDLANALNAEVVLMRVTPSAESLLGHGLKVGGGTEAMTASLLESANSYLATVSAALGNVGGGVKTATVTGPVAEAVIGYATANGVDLIALRSHGLGHAARWVFGSVADRLLQSSPVPVLVTRATTGELEAQEEEEERAMDAALLQAMNPEQK